MKLDVDVLRYLSKDEFRVLTAVEMGMKNHEIVPMELVDRIAGLKHGGGFKNVRTLLRHKLVHHDSSKYDGYRLTNLGYDFLAIKTLANRGLISGVGRQIGVGKESDIFEVVTEDGQVLALKLHRLGRTSFRAVKSKRDYLKHRNSFNWLYLSRLAALKEYAFMKALGDNGFPVPKAVDWNRHCVLMSLVPGYPLVQVKQLQNPDLVFQTIIGLIVRLAEHGLIHCDFNEFNIMVDDDEAITMIDFPQMVSVSHRNAEMYFDRDVNCILKFFNKRFNSKTSEDDESGVLDAEAYYNERPEFHAVANLSATLDKQLEASGFTREDQKDLEQYTSRNKDEDMNDEEGECDRKSGSEEEDDEEEGSPADDTPQVTMSSSLDCQSNGVETFGEVFTEDQSDTEALDRGSDHSEHETTTANSSSKDVKHSKNLEKRRRQAASAVRAGTKPHSSRNTSKDKGGRRSRHGAVGSKLDF